MSSTSELVSKVETLTQRVGTEIKGKLSQSGADQRYLGIEAKAVSASHADTATSTVSAVSATVAESASKDGQGNIISETYVRKDEIAEISLPETVDLGNLPSISDTNSSSSGNGDKINNNTEPSSSIEGGVVVTDGISSSDIEPTY